MINKQLNRMLLAGAVGIVAAVCAHTNNTKMPLAEPAFMVVPQSGYTTMEDIYKSEGWSTIQIKSFMKLYDHNNIAPGDIVGVPQFDHPERLGTTDIRLYKTREEALQHKPSTVPTGINTEHHYLA